ncbi:hypothetical protein [Thermoflavimicrobium daqui]|uniref:SMI1/KNR4 family protein n=1 Tax=Thermoflavimicrobium daqui TaxID=2137476 RepID=A0A364K7H5_9BACL|nr:hypothetical protein [Thermoflavimicrobium daqui]RAL26228.1 hypothetical protein DL897_04310 [Thermoflavimicrobium daqui]
MELCYHQEALQFMNLKPSISKTRLLALEEMEAKYQQVLPRAFKELYVLNGIEEWFKETNQDFLKQIDALFIDRWEDFEEEIVSKDITLAHLKKGTIHFFTENQGVVTWEMLLDGSDDPPVVVKSIWEEWVIASPRLSDFFLAVTWDHALLRENCEWVSIDFEAAKPFLYTEFKQLPTTYGWPVEGPSLRFQKGNWRLLLQGGGREDVWMGGWEDEEEFERFAKLVHIY